MNAPMLKHAKVAHVRDSADDKVSTNAWNDCHVLSGTPDHLVGMDADGNGIEVSVGSGLAYSAGALTNIGTAAGLQSVADRTTLAAVTGQVAGGARVLAESGREGTFIWSTANLSAFVTADASQGIYVAPASDTTGASGAWVRKYSGATSCKWFGATGDGVTNDSASIVAALAFLQSIAGNPANTIYKASGKLFIPAGKYYCGTTTIDITHTLTIEGEGGGGFGAGGGGATMLQWDDGTTGIRVQEYNTTGVSTVIGSPYHLSGAYTMLKGLYLYGGFSSSESESHGIHAKSKIILDDVSAENWPGDALYAHTSSGSGSPNEGNSNCSRAYNCHFRNSRNGISILGGDANAWLFLGCFFDYNRSWGVNDTSFLGNTYVGCHEDSNGITAAAPPFGVCVVSVGGYRYACVYNQEANASVNPPKSSTVTITIASPGVVSWTAHGLAAGVPVSFSTTGALPTGLAANTTYYVVSPATDTFQVATSVGGTAINTSGSQSGTHTAAAALDTAYWYYLGAGGVNGTAIPAWVSGMTLRAGGPMLLYNSNASSVVSGNYVEGGQGPIQQTQLGMVIGGSVSTGVRGGAYLRGYTSGYFRMSQAQVLGNFVQYQRSTESFIVDGSGDSTSLANINVTLRTGIANTGATTINFNKSDNSNMGKLSCVANAGLFIDGILGVILRCNGVDTTTVNSTGLNLASGKTLQYAGAAIISGGIVTGGVASTLGVTSASGTAGIGYATGAGGAVTQLTSKSTGVTLSKVCGQITMNNAALASATGVSFTVTNTTVAATDTIDLVLASGNATAGTYNYQVDKVSAGSFVIWVKNISAGSLSEALVFSYSVKKAVAA